MKCRHCGAALGLTLIDLGQAPLSNGYLTEQQLALDEPSFPLKVMVCEHCWLVQTVEDIAPASIFGDQYAYFSSCSSSWLAHARQFVDQAVARFGLDSDTRVVEIACNDGYLLQYVRERNIPCLGVEPTASTASAARDRGLEVKESFFGERLAGDLVDDGWRSDLVVANNVLAHVPDLGDFLGGFRVLLKQDGVAVFEFPHLVNLVDLCQFDTIYHEHYSYLSMTAVDRLFAANGLEAFDVEKIPTHGGSLRVYAQLQGGARPVTAQLAALRREESEAGVASRDYYRGFAARAARIRDGLRDYLADSRKQGRFVAAYGAAAKGSTLLNFAGIGPELLPLIVDRSPGKQGRFMPGSHIPIQAPEALYANPPDDLLVLPWNIVDEIRTQLSDLVARGTRLVVPIPEIIFV